MSDVTEKFWRLCTNLPGKQINEILADLDGELIEMIFEHFDEEQMQYIIDEYKEFLPTEGLEIDKESDKD